MRYCVTLNDQRLWRTTEWWLKNWTCGWRWLINLSGWRVWVWTRWAAFPPAWHSTPGPWRMPRRPLFSFPWGESWNESRASHGWVMRWVIMWDAGWGIWQTVIHRAWNMHRFFFIVESVLFVSSVPALNVLSLILFVLMKCNILNTLSLCIFLK